MKHGVNLTGPSNVRTIQRLIRTKSINFVEILIDNFLHIDAGKIEDFLEGTPCAFHIMQSHFLTRNKADLKQLAAQICLMGNRLKPLYYSDHLAYFWLKGRKSSMSVEVNYDHDLQKIGKALAWWQDRLGSKIYLENFPSYQAQKESQANFYQNLFELTGSGLLFDVSNATIAELNGALPFSAWLPIVSQAPHWHIGGYVLSSPAKAKPLYVDSHDQPVSDAAIVNFSRARSTNKVATLSVEWDNNISFKNWERDLVRLGFNQETNVV